MWSQPCAHVIFDTDPAPRGGHEPAKVEEMCQAMIRSVRSCFTLPMWPLSLFISLEYDFINLSFLFSTLRSTPVFILLEILQSNKVTSDL